MNTQRIVCSFFFTLVNGLTFGQTLTDSDFVVGRLAVNALWDSTSLCSVLGKPTKVERIIDDHRYAVSDTSYLFYFDSLTIATGANGIRWFEFTSTEMITHRGIKIGDSAEKVRSLYGQPSEEDFLGCPSGLPYFEPQSTLGLTFCLLGGHVVKIIVGWGST